MTTQTSDTKNDPTRLIETQRAQQEQCLDQIKKELEDQRLEFQANLGKSRQDHLDDLVDDLMQFGFETANGGSTNAARRFPLAPVSLSAYSLSLDLESAIRAARNKAGAGKTPVVIVAKLGPGSGGKAREAPVHRVLLVADLSDIAAPRG